MRVFAVGRPLVTLIASLKVRNLPIFRCRRRPNTSLSSTPRPPKHWGLPCRRPNSIVLTR